ncbi:Spermidine/putrescine-binding periplasmic protein precursor [Actinomadura rubteroloni]|uniref:Spermidine/putrescine-binding periplasmic protein n=1 Tax=Actinomadura rubteroloni TaxID=1926885 RepID=A0A2P4ULM7_9ACTN|nr:spermidine/putrescine ABC transporter substrate-binding protein [Actinomadura rubteroloni]POM25950.1 Spermidine/putrescine-binding periplasmic protein precursor [Actinomadura rubteroloni]
MSPVRRRDALRLAGAALALSACGVKGRAASTDVASFWAGKRRTGRLSWANWPGYLEDDRATLTSFEKDTGIRVAYREAIQEMGPWFGKIRAPLAAGQSIGFDLMVMTNGIQLEQCRRLGYLAPLDLSRLPNFAAHAAPEFRNPSYDPGNAFTVPYESGITGIAYNTKYVDEEITSIAQLFSPKYRGRVGMMSDAQELGSFGLFSLGVDPETSRPPDWEKAAARLREQRDAGIVRKYYTQDYVDAVSKGDVWLTMAWSGDVYTLTSPDVKFVVPSEGGTLWTDNLCIPRTAVSPVDALTLMDWLYLPAHNAPLTEFVNYITPVAGVREIVRRDAARAAGRERDDLTRLGASPLVFPSPSDMARLRRYRRLSPDEQSRYLGVFEPIARGS